MATKKRNSNAKIAMEVGAGVLAAAAAAGATYYFYGDTKAKKHRQAASKWAKGMKSEVVREAKKLKRLDQKAMARIVDQAAAVYEGVRSVDRKDLNAAAGELKRNWERVKSEVRGSSRKTAKRTTAKTAVKAVKKATKKSAKKSKNRSR